MGRSWLARFVVGQGCLAALPGVARVRSWYAAGNPVFRRQPGEPHGQGGHHAGRCSTHAPCPAGQCRGRSGACGPCLVFVSSSEHTGNLGGLAGADAICHRLARAAGLPGSYLAWLSSGSSSPGTRFTRATVPYTLVDGTVVAETWDDLTRGHLRHAIDRAETGGQDAILGDTAWSNTLTDGTPAGSAPGAHCRDWTSAAGHDDGHVGIPFSTDDDWTFTRSLMYCAFPQRLYCFQQPRA